MEKEIVLSDLMLELEKAEEKYPPFQNRHEGYGIILEELDELWEEIKKKNPDSSKLYTEALHVAVTAIRFNISLFGEAHDKQ